MKKKNALKPTNYIDEIELIIKKQQWLIVDKKYDFYQSYISTFDGLNYEAKIDFYIAFTTKSNYLHKMYFYFLEFNTNRVFKISDIKSPEHPKGQITTRVADFKYYKTTGNLGFSCYHSPINGQKYNLSHNYHSLFNALMAQDTSQELSYVCVLLKYHNHAKNKKQSRYYVNSYQKFLNAWILKIERFETRKARMLAKQAKYSMIKAQKIKHRLIKKPRKKTPVITD